MTLSVQNPVQRYLGNGISISFAVPFELFALTDLDVELFDTDDVQIAIAQDGAGTYDYVVVGDFTAATDRYEAPSVRFNTAPLSGYQIGFRRGGVQSQELNLTSGGPLPAESLERRLDRVVALIQDIEARLNGVPQHPIATDAYVDFGGAIARNVGDPVLDQDAVTKAYIRTQIVTGEVIDSAKVNSVALLRALSVGGADDPITALVSGYYALGDGGGGIYYYSAGSVVADDGGTVIAPDVGSGRWLLQHAGRVSVLCYGAKGDGVTDDAQAFINALAGLAVNGGTLLIPARDYAIGTTLTWPTNVGCQADAAAILSGVNGCTGGVILGYQYHVGPMTLPRIRNFTSFGLKLLATNNLDLFIESITGCGNNLWIDTVHATHFACLDTTIRFNHMGGAGSTRGIYITADNDANLIQGLEIRGNFITEVAEIVRFASTASNYPGWDSNVIVLQATDNAFAANSRVFVTNQRLSNCVLKVEAWCGGLPAASTSKFLEGPFQVCDISLALAQNPIDGQFALTGSVANQVNLRRPQHSGETSFTPVTTPASKASFNGGVPCWKNWNKFAYVLPSALPAFATLDLYIYHQLPGCDGDLNIMVLPSGEGALPIPVISVQNQHAINANEIKIILKNPTGSAIALGTGIYFAVRCGLW